MKAGQSLTGVFVVRAIRFPTGPAIKRQQEEEERQRHRPTQIPLYAPQPYMPPGQDGEGEGDPAPRDPADDWRYNY